MADETSPPMMSQWIHADPGAALCGGKVAWDLSGGCCTRCGAEGLDGYETDLCTCEPNGAVCCDSHLLADDVADG